MECSEGKDHCSFSARIESSRLGVARRIAVVKATRLINFIVALRCCSFVSLVSSIAVSSVASLPADALGHRARTPHLVACAVPPSLAVTFVGLSAAPRPSVVRSSMHRPKELQGRCQNASKIVGQTVTFFPSIFLVLVVLLKFLGQLSF